MNLNFSEEQLMMRDMVRDFAQKEIAPFVERMEAGEFPRPVLNKMAELGLMGITVPEAYGGSGMDFTSYIIAINELSKVSAVIGVILSVHTSVGTNPILYFGSEEQKQKYVTKLAKGEYLGAFCLTEPSAGSDAASLRTRAEKKATDTSSTVQKSSSPMAGKRMCISSLPKRIHRKAPKGLRLSLLKKAHLASSSGRMKRKWGCMVPERWN